MGDKISWNPTLIISCSFNHSSIASHSNVTDVGIKSPVNKLWKMHSKGSSGVLCILWFWKQAEGSLRNRTRSVLFTSSFCCKGFEILLRAKAMVFHPKETASPSDMCMFPSVSPEAWVVQEVCTELLCFPCLLTSFLPINFQSLHVFRYKSGNWQVHRLVQAAVKKKQKTKEEHCAKKLMGGGKQ